MSVCSYKNCSNIARAFSAITFFQLPTDQPRRSIWIENSGNSELVGVPLHKRRLICEKHFDDQYFRKQFNRTLLRRDAVPVKYGQPAEVQEPDSNEDHTEYYLLDNSSEYLSDDENLVIVQSNSTQMNYNYDEIINEEFSSESLLYKDTMASPERQKVDSTSTDNQKCIYHIVEHLNQANCPKTVPIIDKTVEQQVTVSKKLDNQEDVQKNDEIIEQTSNESPKDLCNLPPDIVVPQPPSKKQKSNNDESAQIAINKSKSTEIPLADNGSTGQVINCCLNLDSEEALFALSLVGPLQRLLPQKRAMAKLGILRYLCELEFGDLAEVHLTKS